MKEKESFNQNEYIQSWKEKHKVKKWVADLKEDEKIKLDKLIKKRGFSSNKVFLLKCIELLEEDKIKS